MASKSLGTLTLDLIAKIGGFVGPMDQAQRKSKESMSKIAGYAKTAATAFAAAGVAIGASVAAMAKSGIDAADSLLDISDATGIATEQLSALKYAADIEDISLDKLSSTLNKFSKTVSEAADGVGAGADAFAALGVSVTNSDGSLRDSYSILNDVSEAISQLENGADKAAVAQQLFGKSGAQLLPILNGGRQGLQGYADQAERLNLIISRDTAEASAQFNDNLKDLKLALGGVGLTIAEEVAPRLAELTSTLTDESTQRGLATFADGLARVASLAVDAAAGLGNFSSFLNRAINGADPQNLSQITAEIENIQSVLDSPIAGRLNPLLPTRIAIQDEEELRKSLERLLAIREQVIADSGQKSLEAELNAQGWEDAFSNERPKAFGVTQSDAEATKKANEESAKAVEELNRQYEAMVATLHQQNMLSAEATELEKVRYDYTYGSLKGINAEHQKVLDGLAAELDAKEKLREGEEALAQARKEFAAIHEESMRAAANLVDLEDFRSQRERENLEKQMEVLKAKGVWTAEIEAEAHKALEEQEEAHQARIKEIKDKAIEDDLKRRQIQIAGAESLFGALGDLTEEFGKKNSSLRRAFLIAEKTAAIAQATIAINAGIAEASKLKFPANLGAMASVASATAGLIGNIEGVNIAHGGLDYVPKEQTYLLDKGERVLSPRQNTDLTNFINSARKDSAPSAVNVQIINSSATPLTATAAVNEDGTLKIILNAVEQKLMDDLGKGRGVWAAGQRRYSWVPKGAI